MNILCINLSLNLNTKKIKEEYMAYIFNVVCVKQINNLSNIQLSTLKLKLLITFHDKLNLIYGIILNIKNYIYNRGCDCALCSC